MTEVLDICKRAAAVAPELARLSTAIKDAALRSMADALEERAEDVVRANADDVRRAESEGVSGALVDRLRLTDSRIA
ncbi:MAG: glutamate-5-semialdehyde dehydrogenase, partial [Actinomycetota bacterium]